MGSGIPPVFCWTKMGAEAGQSLDSILARKELERRVGGGTFCWGIGNSLGSAPRLAAESSPSGQVEVLFTRMKSSPKKIDSVPESLVLWTSFHTPDDKIANLPNHIMITSRGHRPNGKPKLFHYALVCSSDTELNQETRYGYFDASLTRNYLSRNAVGASQVTAVVHYEEILSDAERPYQVEFHALLSELGFIKLAHPVPLTGKIKALYSELCSATTEQEWESLSRELASLARQQRNADSYPLQGSIFEMTLSL